MQKLRYPVDFIGIKVGYSQEHKALDLGWHYKQHEPIYACADGKVTKIWQDEQFGGGLSLRIEYDNGYVTEFKHLSEVLVKVGDRVVQGQQVAIMGESGWACQGFHLHLNCYLNGCRVNPLDHVYVYPNQQVSEEDKNIVLYYNDEPTPTPVPPTPLKYNIGDKMIFNGILYGTAFMEAPGQSRENYICTITDRYENGTAPYNIDNGLGWVTEDSLTLYVEPQPIPEEPIKVGDWVVPIEKVDYYGTSVVQYDDKYQVTELAGDRVVLCALRDGQLVTWCAMNINDIKKA